MNTNTANPEARLRIDTPFGTGSRRTALLIPEEGSDRSIASSLIESLRSRSR
jgi:hypothetical protein